MQLKALFFSKICGGALQSAIAIFWKKVDYIYLFIYAFFNYYPTFSVKDIEDIFASMYNSY